MSKYSKTNINSTYSARSASGRLVTGERKNSRLEVPVKSMTPAKTMSFAAILALAASSGVTLDSNRVADLKGLPSAEDLAAMGATKGVLLTHQECEPGEAKDPTSESDEKAKA